MFRLPPLQGGTGSASATYQCNAQSIQVNGGGNPLYNPDDGTAMPAANLVITGCLLYTSPSPRDLAVSRMPSSA